jgi:G3E family GTPase
MSHRIRTTIVTGYLGAGKTTLINNLLRKYPEKRFALVENEFGDVSIDSSLIKGVDASRMFELKNGCICCTIVNEYELVLLELAGRFHYIDELLIETTGVADPSQVIRPFLVSPEIRQHYDLAGIICVVDCINYNFHLQQSVASQQIAAADVLAVSKGDYVDVVEMVSFHSRLRQMNPFAEISTAGKEHFSIELADYRKDRKQTLHYAGYTSGTPHHGLCSRTVRLSNPPDRAVFEEWLSYLLYINKSRIFRVKGIVYFRNEPFEYIVHAVGSQWEVVEGDLATEKQTGVLVFIGMLDGLALEWIP